MWNPPLTRILFFILSIAFANSFWLLFSKNIPIHLKSISVFLAIQILVDMIGLKVMQTEDSNQFVYNLFLIFYLPYYLFAVWYRYSGGWVRKIGFYSILFLPLFAIMNILFLQGFYHFNTYTLSLGATLIVLFSINSLYEIFTKTPTNISPTHLPDFWICMGLLVFNGVTFVAYNALHPGMQLSGNAMQVVAIIVLGCNYLMYISFSIGCLCAFNIIPSGKPASIRTTFEQSDFDNADFLS